MNKKIFGIAIVIIFICFLFGWNLGLSICNNYYSKECQKQREYIKVLEMFIKQEDLVKARRYLNEK